MREILERLLEGEIPIREAEKLLQISTMKEIEDVALDIRREIRTGVPEVVWSEGKTSAKVVEIASALLEREGRAIISRVSEEQIEALRGALSDECELWVKEKARLIVAQRRGFQPPRLGRKIGIMTAGTSDVKVAEEARIIAEEMGCEVLTAYDVGIAGFHRHLKPLMGMVEEGVDAIVVVAGMEGALPSVVASLVDIPVIGVPSSVGYGFGAGGIGALTAMLQSCSPGLCVVNIDNGFGAGTYAALIAKRVAKSLKESRGGK
jgi:NCAIR mutase (PurE)-related protein